MTNVVLNAGAGGATLGTDTVLGVDYQKVKVTYSTDGVAPTSVDATHGLPDNLVQIGGNTVNTGTGNTGTGTLRVVLATDQPALSNALPVLQSGTWSVNLGTLNGAALDASVNGILIAQSSATAGQKGPLVQGAVTTGSPTYTTGNTNPLSLTTAGALRIDGSAVTQPVSGTFWQATQPVSIAATVNISGAVTQGGPPWSENITQFGGTNVSTGTGNSGAGIPRVTVAQDSKVLLWDGTTTAALKAASTAAAATDPALVVAISPNNTVAENLTQVGGASISLGSKTSANSLPVVIASDQGAVPALQSGTWTVAQGTAAAGSGAWPVNVVEDTTNTVVHPGDATNKAIRVNVVAGAGSGGTAIADGATFTRGTTNETPAGGVAETSAPTLVTGKAAALSLNLSGGLRVDGSGVTQPVSLASLPALATGGNVIGAVTQSGAPWSENITQFGGVNISTGTGAGGTGIPRVTVSNDSAVKLWDATNTATVKAASTAAVAGDTALVVAISPNNTVASLQSGTWTVQPGNTANTTPWLATNVPGTAPGSTRSRVKAAATTNSTNLKGSAGVLLGYALFNNTASAKFFKFYDKATAPTVGTDTPAFTIIIPANSGANAEWSTGIPFSTGIGYGITGGVTDGDTTATAADDVHGMLLWK